MLFSSPRVQVIPNGMRNARNVRTTAGVPNPRLMRRIRTMFKYTTNDGIIRRTSNVLDGHENAIVFLTYVYSLTTKTQTINEQVLTRQVLKPIIEFAVRNFPMDFDVLFSVTKQYIPEYQKKNILSVRSGLAQLGPAEKIASLKNKILSTCSGSADVAYRVICDLVRFIMYTYCVSENAKWEKVTTFVLNALEPHVRPNNMNVGSINPVRPNNINVSFFENKIKK